MHRTNLINRFDAVTEGTTPLKGILDEYKDKTLNTQMEGIDQFMISNY